MIYRKINVLTDQINLFRREYFNFCISGFYVKNVIHIQDLRQLRVFVQQHDYKYFK